MLRKNRDRCRALAFFIGFVLAQSARADFYLPPLISGHPDFSFPVASVANQKSDSLKAFLGTKGGALLLPFFATCHQSCSAYIEDLKKNPTTLNIILVSIDPESSIQELNDFAAKNSLPSSWTILVPKEWAQLRGALGEVGFSIQKQNDSGENKFQHPAMALVLSNSGNWLGTITGAHIMAPDLRLAESRCAQFDPASAKSSLRSLLIHPEVWVIIGFVLLLAATFFPLLKTLRAKTNT